MDKKLVVNNIIHDDAKNILKYVEPNSVSLTITSPPYRNAIDYSKHISNLKNGNDSWMRGTGKQTTSTYLDLMENIFNKVFHVTKEGGFCCIVIGDEVVNGKLIALPSLLLSRIANTENEDNLSKWRFRDMIIWNKVTSGRDGAGNRFGLFIQWPFPKYFRANIMHEYVIILQKNSAQYDKIKAKITAIPRNRIIKREIANSIWNIAPVPPGSIRHPAPFPEQIPWRLVTLYTKKGDIVLDPMNGSGQTTKVAHQMHRKYIGFDIKKEYVQHAKQRLKQKLNIGNFLIPVYHVENWSTNDQAGYFETEEVDLSKNIPLGYKFIHKTESDRSTNGKRGIYAYYKNATDSYMCFIIGDNGKFSRINLGSINEQNSMLYNVLTRLPDTPFIKANLNAVLETRIVENRQSVKSCMDILEYVKMVQPLETTGPSQIYKITPTGQKIADNLRVKMLN